MESVNILRGIYSHQDFLGINLRRQRQLHEDSINVVTQVESCNEFQQFFGRDGFRRCMFFAIDADLFATFHFSADINLRSRIVTDQHDGEAWPNSRIRHGFHFRSYFGADLRGNFVSV